MHLKRKLPWPLLAIIAVGGLGLALTVLSLPPQRFGADSPYLRIDPDKIMTADACGSCHNKSYEVWEDTPHATGFGTLHKSKYAQGILDKIGGGSIRDESQCLKCHYTAIERKGEVTAVSGVSCESCHGAGQGWINIHANEDIDQADRTQRSRNGGMLHPTADPYGLVANCFECHSVPNEQLINDGGHPNGGLFELVDMVEEIRHNFGDWLRGGSEANREMSDERKRLLLVLGRAIDYEYSIRGMARATTNGTYAKAMESRTKEARFALEEIYASTRAPELKSVLAAGKKAKLIPNNSEALLATADEMRRLLQGFAGTTSGTALAAVDNVLSNTPPPPPPSTSTDETPTTDPATTPATSTDSTVATTPPADSGGGTDTPTTTDTPPAPVAAASNVQGAKKTKPDWFRPTQFKTTLKGCNCHSQAKKWWSGDVHANSTRQINTPRSKQIAANYGLSNKEITLGSQICMQCHGSIKTGQESRPVRKGVGCESCHGPSSGYMNPHKAGSGAGFSKGMIRLKDAAARAENCARCHLITDERLVSSGHPSGSNFSLASGSERIKHWPGPMIERSGAYPELSASALNGALSALKSGRPVPNVTIAQITAPAVRTRPRAKPKARQSRKTSSDGSTPPVDSGSGSTALTIPDNGGFLSTDSDFDSGLPPLPEVSDSTTTEDLLLIIKRRLELLYNNRGN